LPFQWWKPHEKQSKLRCSQNFPDKPIFGLWETNREGAEREGSEVNFAVAQI
jgi:hypothetical protein